MTTIRMSMTGLSVMILMASTAWAHDLLPAPWRGQDGATFAQWTFDSPTDPGTIDNPYGDATASVTLGVQGTGWHDSLVGLGVQTGLWDLGGDGGSIVLEIDNRPLALDYKEIWIQVTYFEDFSQAPIITIPGASFVSSQTQTVEEVLNGGAWILSQSLWRIEPNPSHEQIVIASDPMWGSVIDQIVVDTIRVPEPAGLALLTAGMAVMRRRRQ